MALILTKAIIAVAGRTSPSGQ